MNNKKIKRISDGAMIAAIFGVLFFIDMYLGGLIGYYLYFILPSLIVWYIVRYSVKDSIVLGVAIFFLTLFTGYPISIFYAVCAVIAGIVIGAGYVHKVSGNTMFFSCIGISLLNNILSYTVFAKVFEADLIGEMTEIYETITNYLSISTSLSQFLEYAPLLILIMGLIEGYCLLMITTLILPRLKIPFHYQFNFLLMHLPVWLGIVAIASVAANYFMDNLWISYLYIILYFIVILEGVSVGALYCAMIKKVILYFVVIIIAFIPIIQKVYFVIGLVDIFVGLKEKFLYNKIE